MRRSGKGGEPETEREEAAQFDRSRWFITQGFWKKSAIVTAGPFFNFLFAIIVIAASVLLYGEMVPDETTRIGTVLANSPAEKAGLKAGDFVKNIDGAAVSNWTDLAHRIHHGDARGVKLSVEREGSPVEFNVVPQRRDVMGEKGKEQVLLIGISQTTLRRGVGFGDALMIGATWCYRVSLHTYAGIWGMIRGSVSAKDLAGPILIFDAAGKHAKKGLENLLGFMALLSVSLAVLNLLPIPVLDGGHLLIFVLEAIFGPISVRKKEVAQQVGMVFLLMLMFVAISNDISRARTQAPEENAWTQSETNEQAAPKPEERP